MSDWIPCDKKLPEPDKYVLVTLECGDIDVLAYHEPWNDWMHLNGAIVMEAVFAWQPLPEPYEEEKA